MIAEGIFGELSLYSQTEIAEVLKRRVMQQKLKTERQEEAQGRKKEAYIDRQDSDAPQHPKKLRRGAWESCPPSSAQARPASDHQRLFRQFLPCLTQAKPRLVSLPTLPSSALRTKNSEHNSHREAPVAAQLRPTYGAVVVQLVCSLTGHSQA